MGQTLLYLLFVTEKEKQPTSQAGNNRTIKFCTGTNNLNSTEEEKILSIGICKVLRFPDSSFFFVIYNFMCELVERFVLLRFFMG